MSQSKNHIEEDRLRELQQSLFKKITDDESAEKVIEILQQGADPNGEFVCDGTYYPLHYAIENQRTEIAFALIQNGAKTGCHGIWKDSALHKAAEYGALDLCKFLIKRGCRIDAKNSNGETALFSAIRGRWTSKETWSTILEMATFLLDHGANPNAKNRRGETPIFQAIQDEDWDLCQLLIDRGANVNWTSKSGVTPLHMAHTSCDDDFILDLLYSQGASHLAIDKHGVDAVMLAKNNAERIQDLVARGCSVLRSDNNGMTALHHCAKIGAPKECKVLLELGADLQAKTKEGDSPLHLAFSQSHHDVAMVLIEAGADLHATNDLGMMPMHMVTSSHMSSLEFENHVMLLQEMMRRGLSLDTKMANGGCILHFAAASEHEDLCMWLLDNGADASIRFKGLTPFQCAEKRGHVDFAKQMKAYSDCLNARRAIDSIVGSNGLFASNSLGLDGPAAPKVKEQKKLGPFLFKRSASFMLQANSLR